MEDSDGDEESSWATKEEDDTPALINNKSAPIPANPSVPDLPTIQSSKNVVDTVVGARNRDKSPSADVTTLQSDRHLPPTEWPSLPTKQTKDGHSVLPSGRPGYVVHQGNAWNTGQKKKFMNNGIAKGRKKLNYTPLASRETDFLIDVEKAYSIKDVWGFSLLG